MFAKGQTPRHIADGRTKGITRTKVQTHRRADGFVAPTKKSTGGNKPTPVQGAQALLNQTGGEHPAEMLAPQGDGVGERWSSNCHGARDS